ncbi:DUF2963 domain-containing protein [Candidatus Phytoplasma solani]|uniref:DUF2963 domain-containing protein n=1 Tax=Candidatus Phytoplasma solani TaxID=69896 RepID=UPI00358FE52B
MKHRDDGTIESISEFDQTTGKEIKKTIFQSDGQTIDSIIKIEYDQVTNQKVKETHYQDNGEKINYINELDIETGGLIRQNEYRYRNDGTIENISEVDTNTNQVVKVTYYWQNGTTIDCVVEIVKGTNIKRETYYQDNGEKINYINELDIETGGLIRQNEYRYRNDGTIEAILEFKNYSFINKLVKETRAPKRPKYRAI